MAKRMNATIRGKWVMALRSVHTKYKKGEGYLNRDGCMCAFGVLCDLYRRAHPDSDAARWVETRKGVFGFGSPDNLNVPPAFVLEWAGLPSDKINTWSHPVYQIMTRNDGRSGTTKHDFPMLAEYIEANL